MNGMRTSDFEMCMVEELRQQSLIEIYVDRAGSLPV